jgi:hypothetical protein
MRRSRLPMTLTVAAAAIAVAVGVSACGSGGSSTTSSTTTSANVPPSGGGGGGGGGHPNKGGGGGGPGAPPKTRTKHPGPRHQNQGPPGTKMQHTYAARIVGHGASQGGPIQPAELWPVTNSWRVSDHKNFTAVYAGANPDHHDTGRLVVFRQDFVHVKQNARDVDIQGSGPVTITSAPTGHDVGTSAQKTGEIQFRGTNGVTGTLHLSNDSVTTGSG